MTLGLGITHWVAVAPARSYVLTLFAVRVTAEIPTIIWLKTGEETVPGQVMVPGSGIILGDGIPVDQCQADDTARAIGSVTRERGGPSARKGEDTELLAVKSLDPINWI